MKRTLRPSSSPLLVHATLLGAMLLVGCDPDVGDPFDPEPAETLLLDDEGPERASDPASVQPDSGSIAGTMLARVDVAPGHFVQFWEVEPGVVAIRESISADEVEDPTSAFDAYHDASASVLDAYRVVVPDATTEQIPAALHDAHVRAVERAALDTEWMVERPPPANALPTLDDLAPEPQAVAADACAPDYYADNYGEQWFYNHYCTEGLFRTCVGNLDMTYTQPWLELTSWWKLLGMAADFVTGARMSGGRWYWSNLTHDWAYIKDFDFPVQPRFIEGVYYLGVGYRMGYVIGKDPCMKIHMAHLRNH